MKLNRERLQHLEELAARQAAEWEGCRGAMDRARHDMYAAQAKLEVFQAALSRGSGAPIYTTTVLPGGGVARTADLLRADQQSEYAAGGTKRELERLEKAYADARDAYRRTQQRLAEAVTRHAATDALLTACRSYLQDNGIKL